MNEPRILVYIIYLGWAIATSLVWGRVFINTLHEYRSLPRVERRHPSPPHPERLTVFRARARREMLSDFALMLVGIFAAVSLLVLILGEGVAGARGFALAMALGAFLAAGLVRWKP